VHTLMEKENTKEKTLVLVDGQLPDDKKKKVKIFVNSFMEKVSSRRQQVAKDRVARKDHGSVSEDGSKADEKES